MLCYLNLSLYPNTHIYYSKRIHINFTHIHTTVIMDHYTDINVPARATASRFDSNDSHASIASKQHLDDATKSPAASLDRNDSTQSVEEAAKEQQIDADYAQYTHAPPPYSDKQYEGKSEEQTNTMRMKDYTKEIKRMMGKQLVRGLKNGETKMEPFEHMD